MSSRDRHKSSKEVRKRERDSTQSLNNLMRQASLLPFCSMISSLARVRELLSGRFEPIFLLDFIVMLSHRPVTIH